MNPENTPENTGTPTGAMIRTLGLVSAICGLIIVTAYQSTEEAVAANKKIMIERSILKVMPDAKRVVAYALLPSGEIKKAVSPIIGGSPFFATYDERGKFLGIAAEGAAKGYGDTLRLMFGYRPDCACITGMAVVAMRETPGIGDKIIHDKHFLENFIALEATLSVDAKQLKNEIVTVKSGTKTNNWQIDAISGATITSRAVGKAINDAAKKLLPRLHPAIDNLQKDSP